MKKYFAILLLFVFYTSSSYSQGRRYVDVICPRGGAKANSAYWNKDYLYYYIKNSASSLTSSECQTAIQNAFNTWSQYSDFTFTQTNNSSQADIELSWEPINHSGCSSFDPGDMAHSRRGVFNNSPCDIHFNNTVNFTMTSSDYNLESVALHEIGHILGLDHDTNHPSAVMNEYYDYKTDLTYYDLSTLYSLYGYPDYSIVGLHLIPDEGVYEVDKVHHGYDVVWSLNNNYYNQYCLSQDNPSVNKCTITRSGTQDLVDATLTAVVKDNGVTIQTLTKSGLYAYYDFKGQYTSGNLSGNINYSHVFYVKPNATTYVTSHNFLGATVSYSSSGATPSIWAFSPTYADLTFVTTSTSAPVVINVNDVCGNHYTLYAFPSSSYSMNISNGDNSIMVTLIEDGDASMEFVPDKPWMLEIRNAETGKLMVTQSSKNRSESISTTGWPKGIYVVKVTIDKEELTEKVIVK